MQLLIVFFLISIIFSFLCSIWEAVLLSITPSYVNRELMEGSTTGTLLQQYKKDIDRPLSAILTLNTIAHTVGAIGVGAQAGKLFESHTIDLGFVQISAESIIATLMTLAILFLSEIIPKTIGANLWKRLAPFTVRSIKVLLIILSPLVWFSQLITKNLKSEKHKSVFSRADFAAMTAASEMSGALEKSESKIIKNLLQLDKLAVKDIMTPRSVLLLAEEASTLEEFYQTYIPIPFSRIPVYISDEDHITGLILKDDLLKELVEGNKNKTLSDIKREISAVSPDLSLTNLFENLVTNNIHMAIVVDEFGSLQGLVTMEDLLETILGLEIVDETDTVPNMQKLAREKWLERAKRYGLISDDKNEQV